MSETPRGVLTIKLTTMTLSSIVPSEMTQREIKYVCTELYTAKSWGLDHRVVKLSNGLEYNLPVTRWADYNKHFKPLS